MKKRISGKIRLVRPADALLPLAFLTAELLGRGRIAEETFFLCIAVRLLGLASSNGVRIAFATQPSIRKVCGSVKTALLLQLTGGLLALGIHFATLYGGISAVTPALIGVAVLLNIEQVFYEYLFATGDGASAAMCRLITSVLIAAGMLLAAPDGGDAQILWLVGAAALSALISAVIGLSIGGGLKGKPNAQVIRCAPRAMLQSIFYCAVGLVAWRFRPFGTSFYPFFAGLTVYELCRTPFRRSAMESRRMNRALLIVCGLSILAQLACLPNWMLVIDLGPLEPLRPFLSDIPLAAYMVIVGCACAFALFGNTGVSAPRETS